MVKKIGILTSGGDSSGMNDALLGAIRYGINAGKDMYIVKNGYKGLVTNEFFKVDKHFADQYVARGGTIAKTARLPEFKDEKVRKLACENLKKEGIEALIVVGGDGSYMGAKKLSDMGINCIGLPGTIDNDITSTDFTIGFDTALNCVVESIDRIRDTMSSHNRCGVIEIMGNNCPDLTLYAGIATNADLILTKDHNLTEDEIINRINELKNENADNIIVLVAEKLLDSTKLAKTIEEKTGIVTRATVLGHIQRGGVPTAMERFNAIRMGAYAIELLDQNIGGVCIGLVDNKLTYRDIDEALLLPRNKKLELYDLHEKLR